jgi:hypothetical protein
MSHQVRLDAPGTARKAGGSILCPPLLTRYYILNPKTTELSNARTGRPQNERSHFPSLFQVGFALRGCLRSSRPEPRRSMVPSSRIYRTPPVADLTPPCVALMILET